MSIERESFRPLGPRKRRLVALSLFVFLLLSLFAGFAHTEEGWFEETDHCPACQWAHMALALHLLVLHLLLKLLWTSLPLWLHCRQPHHFLVLALRASRGPPRPPSF